MSSAGELIRETRATCSLSQARLARRARTTTRHVRRIEHGEVSPTVEMVERLLAAMGRELKLEAEVGPLDNRSDLELHNDARLSASERLAQSAALSRTLTGVVTSARAANPLMARGDRPESEEPEGGLPVSPLQIEPMLHLLLEYGTQFVIIGGFSLSLQGIVRATKDIDIMPDPSTANLRRLARALADLEAEPLLADDFPAGELRMGLNEAGLALGGNRALRTRLGRLDVMLAVDGAPEYAELRQRAVPAQVPNAGDCLFASLDDLIAMKLAAGRPQDRIDVASLERVRGEGLR